jgi:stage V sporulation protein SpoVS
MRGQLGHEGYSVVAVHDELTRSRVRAVVEDLGTRGATGYLEVTGDPSGALHLDGGRIVFAQASWVPGLVDRVRGLRPASAELQELLAGWDAGDAAVAALAVQRGYLTAAGLHELIRSIVVDAFLVLVLPLPENAQVTDIRFTSVRTRANALFPRLDVPFVRWEAVNRADRMAKYGLAPATATAMHDRRRPAAVPRQERWHQGHSQAPTAEILREVLDGLRKLR